MSERERVCVCVCVVVACVICLISSLLTVTALSSVKYLGVWATEIQTQTEGHFCLCGTG